MRKDARLRRERIIDAACEIYRSHHHDTVTLDEIARAADVGIATLYRNFPDRRSLIHACAETLFHRIHRDQDRVIAALEAQPQDPANSTAARALWHGHIDYLVTLGLGSLVPAVAPEDLAELPDNLAELRHVTHEKTAHLLRACADHGLVSRTITPQTFILGLITVSRPPAAGLAKLDPGFTAELVDIFVRGLAAQK